MKTDDLKQYLKDRYDFSENEKTMTIQAIEEEQVIVVIGSVSSSANSPVYILRGFPKNDNSPEQRLFIFCGETEENNAQHLKNAIYNSNHPNDDYIISVELLEKNFKKDQAVLRGMHFNDILKFADKHYDTGIYRKRVNGTPSYNLIMIRVKENGQVVRKYMDAYLASSDIGTFHDIHYTIAQYQSPQKTNGDPKDYTDWPHNLLIFGAPGTGKSFSISEKIKELGWENNMQRVTFFEDYSYEKFVGAYLPYMGDKEINYQGSINGDSNINIRAITEKNIEYRFVPGIFLKMIADAKFDSILGIGTNYVLVIEEINRANAASVFGDFFQLLDRESSGKSEYSISLPDEMKEWLTSYLNKKVGDEKYEGDRDTAIENFSNRLNDWIEDFRLPENLYIWATMNSADQGVYPMDAAFKRRWSYLYKTTMGNSGYIITIKWNVDGYVNDYVVTWDVLKYAINHLLEQSGNIDEDRFVGPYFFKKTEIEQITAFTETSPEIRGSKPDPITNKLLQYLRQDVVRNNPRQIFQDDFLSMNNIREGMINGVGLNQILKLDGIMINDKDIKDCLKKPISEDGRNNGLLNVENVSNSTSLSDYISNQSEGMEQNSLLEDD